MAEARLQRDADTFHLQAGATVSAYEVWQLPSGEAAFLDKSTATSSGSYTDQFRTAGKVTIEKTTSMVLLAGQEVYWDHSANKAHYAKVNDRDFFLGTVVQDAASADLVCIVDLNKRGNYKVDAINGPALSTTTGTVAAGGFDRARRIGGTQKLLLSSTNEAQKADLLSVDGFSLSSNWIVEASFRVVSDGAGSAPDFNIGVANGTHASDADSITESVFIHLDGNNTNINAESDDGTTEVAATDTTLDYTEGSAVAQRVHVLIDGRNPADVQIYVNGALVLDGTTFNVNAATGPLFLLAHLEKTSAADTYEIDVDCLRCWTSEQ